MLGSPLPSWERLDAEPRVGGRPQLPLVSCPTSATAAFRTQRRGASLAKCGVRREASWLGAICGKHDTKLPR